MSFFSSLGKYSGIGLIANALGGGDKNKNQPVAPAAPQQGPAQTVVAPVVNTTTPTKPWVLPDFIQTGSTDPNSYGDALMGLATKFTDPNAEINKAAYNKGVARANERGLINSGLAGQNAQAAVMEQGVPLAQGAFNAWNQNQQASNAYGRDFMGTLAALPIKSSYDMLQGLMQAAIDDPASMTPEIMNGFSNFFQKNFTDLLSNYQYADGTKLGEG